MVDSAESKKEALSFLRRIKEKSPSSTAVGEAIKNLEWLIDKYYYLHLTWLDVLMILKNMKNFTNQKKSIINAHLDCTWEISKTEHLNNRLGSAKALNTYPKTEFMEKKAVWKIEEDVKIVVFDM